jgi:hypothetical protein
MSFVSTHQIEPHILGNSNWHDKLAEMVAGGIISERFQSKQLIDLANPVIKKLLQ